MQIVVTLVYSLLRRLTSGTSDWEFFVVHPVGLKRDGSLVFAGSNGEGQCNTSGWPRILLPQ